jgi:hypothetical protein
MMETESTIASKWTVTLPRLSVLVKPLLAIPTQFLMDPAKLFTVTVIHVSDAPMDIWHGAATMDFWPETATTW